jgi:hypothetical protein
MNVLELGVSKLGRFSKRINSLRTLLLATELPAGPWKLVSESAWRQGGREPGETSEDHQVRLATANERLVRARQARGYLAFRAFKVPESESHLSVRIQLLPYATLDDARSAVAAMTSNAIRVSDGETTMREECRMPEPDIPGVDTASAYEITISKSLTQSIARCVIANVNQLVFIIIGEADGDGLAWEVVTSTAALQALKIVATPRVTARSARVGKVLVSACIVAAVAGAVWSHLSSQNETLYKITSPSSYLPSPPGCKGSFALEQHSLSNLYIGVTPKQAVDNFASNLPTYATKYPTSGWKFARRLSYVVTFESDRSELSAVQLRSGAWEVFSGTLCP